MSEFFLVHAFERLAHDLLAERGELFELGARHLGQMQTPDAAIAARRNGARRDRPR